MLHDRSDQSGTPTALREEPRAASAPQLLAVKPLEEVSVLSMQSSVANGAAATWAMVQCDAGKGWVQRSHLHETSTKVLHRRQDNPMLPTVLRSEPCVLTTPSQELLVEPEAAVLVLSTHIELSPVDSMQICWVQISLGDTKGWLKRSNLTLSTERDVKRQRVDDMIQHRQFHLKNLGWGGSAEEHLQELRTLLSAHGLILKHHTAPRERQRSEKPVNAKQEPSMSTSMPPPQLPLLSRWYVHELTLEGHLFCLERLSANKLILSVDGLVMEFKPPLEKRKALHGKPRATYSERPINACTHVEHKVATQASSMCSRVWHGSEVPDIQPMAPGSLAAAPSQATAVCAQRQPPIPSSQVWRGHVSPSCGVSPGSVEVPCSQAAR